MINTPFLYGGGTRVATDKVWKPNVFMAYQKWDEMKYTATNCGIIPFLEWERRKESSY